jgi:hypothetical protein
MDLLGDMVLDQIDVAERQANRLSKRKMALGKKDPGHRSWHARPQIAVWPI